MPLIEDDDPAQLDLGQQSFRNRLLAGRNSHLGFLRECEIAAAWAQTRADLAAGRYRRETAGTHTARVEDERADAPGADLHRQQR